MLVAHGIQITWYKEGSLEPDTGALRDAARPSAFQDQLVRLDQLLTQVYGSGTPDEIATLFDTKNCLWFFPTGQGKPLPFPNSEIRLSEEGQARTGKIREFFRGLRTDHRVLYHRYLNACDKKLEPLLTGEKWFLWWTFRKEKVKQMTATEFAVSLVKCREALTAANAWLARDIEAASR